MKLLSLHLFTDQIAETRHFYKENLGLELLSETEDSLCFRAGSTALYFRLSEQKYRYHFAFNIPAKQLSSSLDWLQNRVELLETEPNAYIVQFENWRAESVYFYDNNGNIVEFIAREAVEPAFSAVDFEVSQILSVSEIGWVSENVPAESAKLQSEYGLSPFTRQSPREDFAALGDDEGLLLISGNKRNWFPTAHQATASPFELVLEDKNGVHSFSLG